MSEKTHVYESLISVLYSIVSSPYQTVFPLSIMRIILTIPVFREPFNKRAMTPLRDRCAVSLSRRAEFVQKSIAAEVEKSGGLSAKGTFPAGDPAARRTVAFYGKSRASTTDDKTRRKKKNAQRSGTEVARLMMRGYAGRLCYRPFIHGGRAERGRGLPPPLNPPGLNPGLNPGLAPRSFGWSPLTSARRGGCS